MGLLKHLGFGARRRSLFAASNLLAYLAALRPNEEFYLPHGTDVEVTGQPLVALTASGSGVY